MSKGIYDKRISLIESGHKPTYEELKEAYGYLDYCLECGKPFSFWDSISFNVSHSIFGNNHRRKCSDKFFAGIAKGIERNKKKKKKLNPKEQK